MKYNFDKYKTKHQQLITRLKHLRGRHDQLDHAWNRGMGRGGGGAALAPNQMGPLPTTDFYRQRRIELMEQQRQGQITNAEMRRQMRDLRGITVNALDAGQSDDITLANRRRPAKPTPGQLAFDFDGTSSPQSTLTQRIADFTTKRESERLPNGFDISPFVGSMIYAGQGISGVQQMVINGKVYFYRNTPVSWGTHSNFTLSGDEVWSLLRGSLKGLAADNIATAMGLAIAPPAAVTSEGFVITSDAPIDSQDAFTYLQKLMSEYQADPTNDEKFEQLRRVLEPLAIMDIIMGQNDGHYGNIALFINSNTDIYDAPYIWGSVDYDLTGRNKIFSKAIDLWTEVLSDERYSGKILTSQMREILTQLESNIQWHPLIPDFVKKQYLARLKAILLIDSQSYMSDFAQYNPNFNPIKTSIVLREALLDQAEIEVDRAQLIDKIKSEFLMENEYHFVDYHKKKRQKSQAFNTLIEFLKNSPNMNNVDIANILLQNGIDINNLDSFLQPELSQLAEIPNDFYEVWDFFTGNEIANFSDEKTQLRIKLDGKFKRLNLIRLMMDQLNATYPVVENHIANNNAQNDPQQFLQQELQSIFKTIIDQSDVYIGAGPFFENGFMRPYYEKPEIKSHFMQIESAFASLLYLAQKNNTLLDLAQVFSDFGIRGTDDVFSIANLSQKLFDFAREQGAYGKFEPLTLLEFLQEAYYAATSNPLGSQI